MLFPVELLFLLVEELLLEFEEAFADEFEVLLELNEFPLTLEFSSSSLLSSAALPFELEFDDILDVVVDVFLFEVELLLEADVFISRVV